MHKKDLASYYNQDIERLKLEQESLKAQVDAELLKLKRKNMLNETVSKISSYSYSS